MNEKERAVLREYMNLHPVNYPGDIDTLIETLYWWHTQYNPVEDEDVKETLAGVEAQIHELTREESDVYMDTINKACSEYERAAYMQGIKVGMRLVMEMVAD